MEKLGTSVWFCAQHQSKSVHIWQVRTSMFDIIAWKKKQKKETKLTIQI